MKKKREEEWNGTFLWMLEKQSSPVDLHSDLRLSRLRSYIDANGRPGVR